MRINWNGTLPVLIIVVLITIMGSGTLLPAQSAAQTSDITCTPAASDAATIDDAKLYIEYNYTDGDLGVHGYFDDHGWSELCVYDPSGVLFLAVNPGGSMGDLGMASIFFEGREPTLDVFDFPELIAAFPEGEYTLTAVNHDGTTSVGAATFTHNAPTPPTITAPVLYDEEEAEEVEPLPLTGLVIAWEPVTQTVAGDPVTIIGYEVIVTNDDYDEIHAFSQPIFDVHLPPDHTSLTVSPEFLEPDTLYEVEVLAIEESGNQTISLGFFMTEE